MGQGGNERGKGRNIVSEGGQAKMFPVCTGYTVVREELVCWGWGGAGMLARC